jgi:ribosomal-protein-alanine N-acetyltransferase
MPGARVLEGERVTLRTVEQEDVPFVQRTFANPDIRYPTGNPVRSQEQIGVDEDESDQFLVCLDGDGAGPESPAEDDARRIGWVGAREMAYKRPEVGYWLVPEVHGEGYGTEAVSLLVDYVFREYDTPAVGAVAYDFNEASRSLLASLGFVEEGRRRKFMFVDGAHRDMVEYGLLREEWEKGRERT